MTNKTVSLIYALDLGGTSTKAALFDLDSGELLDKFTFSMGYGEEIVPSFKSELHKRLRGHNWQKSQVKAIGLVIKSAYDNEKGIAIRAVGLGWFNYPIRQKMQVAFPNCPTFVNNDATGAMLGEWKYGAGKRYSSLIYVIIGRGVGSGILLKNKIWNGAHNLSGELGHGGNMQHMYDCGCEVGTCVEGSSSAYAMEKAFSDYASAHPQSKIASYWKPGEKRIALKDLAPLIKVRDLTATEIFNKCLDPLASRIALAVFMLDVEAVIIGGAITALGEYLIQPLWKLMRKYLWKAYQDRVTLRVAQLGNAAGIYGAFTYAKEQLSAS